MLLKNNSVNLDSLKKLKNNFNADTVFQKINQANLRFLNINPEGFYFI